MKSALISEKGMKTAMEVINPGVRQCDAVGEIQKSLFYGTEEYGENIQALRHYFQQEKALHFSFNSNSR